MVAVIPDERGRVPFAVVAVLLLVSSATIAATVGRAPPPDEPAVDVVADRVEAEGQTALRRAVREAATAAASDPVIEPANTTVGRAIGPNRTFRRSLRLRIYAAARENLGSIERRRGDVTATAELPPVDPTDPASVRAAIDRVDLSAADPNATAITVRLRNLTTAVRRGDRVLSEGNSSPRVTVATPVLALHDRVTAYEKRLDAPLTEPGLEQRLSVILNGAGWARGYAQYGGAPIDNVISNSHVELATNAAAIDVQRSTIGRVDPGGIEGMTEAVAKHGAQQFLAMKGEPSPFLQRALDSHDVVDPNEIEGLNVPARDEPMTVGVNRTAEDTFLLMVSEEPLPPGYTFEYGEDVRLAEIFRNAYAARARLSATVTDRSGGRPDPSPPAGTGWQQVSTAVDESVRVTTVSAGSNGSESGEWHALETYTRRVVAKYERTTTWQRGALLETTRSTGSEAATVTIAVEGSHAFNASGPDGRIDGVHVPGAGPLDGPNLAGVESAAIDRLIGERGGRDAVARRVAFGSLDAEIVTVAGEQPSRLRNWVYRDLRELRERVYDASVSVDRRDVGTFAVNPPALLAEKVRNRRAALLDASPPYDGVADRARVAARARYLRLVIDALERRAEKRRGSRDELSDALSESDAGSIADLQRSVHASASGPGPRQAALTGPGGPVRIRVDAAPAYLTRSEVTEKDVPAVDGAIHPLAARNVNQFSLPYGEVIGGLLDAILGGTDRTSLDTAARTLRSGNDLAGELNASARGTRQRLEHSIDEKLDVVERTAAETLAEYDVEDSEEDRRHVARIGFAGWRGTAAKAIAVSNGSVAPAIAEVAAERAALSDVERDRLSLELDRAIRGTLASEEGQPKLKVVDAAFQAAKSELSGAAEDLARKYADRAVTRLTNGTLTSMPNGLPLAAVPGYWYATTNVWTIEVEGEYARFGVRATRGRPSEPGAGLAYARDGDVVTVDVDGDGSAERLGRSRRVQFSAMAHVAVVVPPGAQGVGDVGGPRDERSAGWSDGGE